MSHMREQESGSPPYLDGLFPSLVLSFHVCQLLSMFLFNFWKVEQNVTGFITQVPRTGWVMALSW